MLIVIDGIVFLLIILAIGLMFTIAYKRYQKIGKFGK